MIICYLYWTGFVWLDWIYLASHSIYWWVSWKFFRYIGGFQETSVAILSGFKKLLSLYWFGFMKLLSLYWRVSWNFCRYNGGFHETSVAILAGFKKLLSLYWRVSWNLCRFIGGFHETSVAILSGFMKLMSPYLQDTQSHYRPGMIQRVPGS